MIRNRNYFLNKIGDETILIPVGSEVIRLNGLLLLNRTAEFIWHKLENEVSQEEIVESIIDKFEVSRQTASEKVNEFLNQLKEKGMVS